MQKIFFIFIALCLLSLQQMTVSRAQNLPLTNQGQPVARIVVGATATSTEKYAAQELQRALQLMSGAQLSIGQAATANAAQIVIGTPQSSSAIKSANLFNTKSEEETRVVRRGNTLYLAGPTPRAALQATYTFLHETLGARWFWPGDSGEYLPKQPSIAVGNLDVRHVPSLWSRKLSINDPHFDEETATWMARNRMNGHNVQTNISKEYLVERGLQIMIGGHNLVLPHELLEKHPEYMAEYGGKRQIPVGHPPHLCWANPGVQEEVVKMASQWWEDNPLVTSISFFGADHNHFCECSLCAAWAPDVTTRWQKFSKIVISKLNEEYPGKEYQTLAYQAYRDVPKEVAPYSIIGYTTYNIDYTKPLAHEINAAARGEIKAWQQVGGRMGIRGYQFIPFREPMFAPIASIIVDEIKWSKENGLVGWESEVAPYNWPRNSPNQSANWITNRLALYAVAQAMWNSNIDTKQLVRDWNQTVYGAAGESMNDYYWLMDNAWNSSKIGLGYFLQPPAGFVSHFISDDLLKQADASFAQARQKAAAIADGTQRQRVQEQIQLESTMLDKWRQVYLLQKGRAAHFQAYAPLATGAPQLGAEAGEEIWKSAGRLPAFEDAQGNAIAPQTEAYVLWDNEKLYLRFVAHDDQIKNLTASDTGRDNNPFPDDNIELFLENVGQPGHYYHLAFNTKDAFYDAKSDGAMNFDKTWNPQWQRSVKVLGDRWIADVALPFNEFGVTAKEAANWKMSFKRGATNGRSGTGWPDAAYHNPASFGTLTLVNKVPEQKRILLYDAEKSSTNLRSELAKFGFTIKNIASDEAELKAALANGTDLLLLRRPGTFALSNEFLSGPVRTFLENGGVVVVSAYAEVPLDQWFGPTAAVKWSGWAIDENRITRSSTSGVWQQKPHDITGIIRNGLTPANAYLPRSDAWEVLANLKMKNGEDHPYLLRQRIGKGTLVLTSSDMGYGGGHEIFGNQNPQATAMLLENLLVSRE